MTKKLTPPNTEVVKGGFIFGVGTAADRITGALGLPNALPDEAVAVLFDEWLDGEKAFAFQEALAAVQEQINENVPITADTVLRIENPYVRATDD